MSSTELFADEAHVTCMCNPGYFGDFCQYTRCDLYPCHNGGVCDPSSETTPCSCPPNFSGKYCDTPVYALPDTVDPIGELLGPNHHLMAGTSSFKLLPRLEEIFLMHAGYHVAIISGGFVPNGLTGNHVSGGMLDLSPTTWLYNEKTGKMVDVMQLVAQYRGDSYTVLPVNSVPQTTVEPYGKGPWGSSAHSGARAGHSFVFVPDNSVPATAPPSPSLADAFVVFGGLLAVPSPGSGPSFAYSNQLWLISLWEGTAEWRSGAPAVYGAPSSGTMQPTAYNPAIVDPQHEVGEKEYRGKHPSGRAHHVSQLLTVGGKRWLYVHGGVGADVIGQFGFLADLWRLDVDKYTGFTDAAGVTTYTPNENYLKWQYIGCSVSRQGYVFTNADISPSTPVYVSSTDPSHRQGCPSARAHAASSVDEQGRLWVVGGVGERGPLDDIWVYDPSMGDLGAWFKIQGTGHSGIEPASVPPMTVDNKLLWYHYALFGIGSAQTGIPETSWTLAATVPELGAGCGLGTACPLVSSQTQSQFTNSDDANEYAVDFSRIGALVGAAATATSDGKTMMLYGGLSKTRTYIPVFDNPHNSWFAGFSANKMPFQTNTPIGRFYFIYNSDDMANVKAVKTQVITQLAFALTTPLSGLYQIAIGYTITAALSATTTAIDGVTMAVVAEVSSTSGHVVNNYLTLSGLNIDITSLTDGNLLVIVMQATRSTSSPTFSSLHNTLISCAPTAASETSLLTQPYSPSVLAGAAVLPRIAFSYYDTNSASYQGHTLANCAAAMRFSHYGRPAMGPSNLLWSIDMSKATSALGQTTATLVSGSLLPRSKPARHKFYSRTDISGSGPSGPTDPIGAIGYAYTYGLHAAVAEICQDWFRFSSRMYSDNLALREGAADLLLHQAGYEITQSAPAPSDSNEIGRASCRERV